jgi:hypothetical protein
MDKKELKRLIEIFIKNHCEKCSSYVFCGSEMVLMCKHFDKFLKENS